MPKYWYDLHHGSKPEGKEDREKFDMNFKLTAYKKPYFMIYIYNDLMKEYKTYIKNANIKSTREFRLALDELLAMDEEDLTDRQKEFIYYYHKRMPVSMNNCVMNRICHEFEKRYSSVSRFGSSYKSFDYTILKNGVEYTYKQRGEIQAIYDAFCRDSKAIVASVSSHRITRDEKNHLYASLYRNFEVDCAAKCSDASKLCDILLDICYTNDKSRPFVWQLCGDNIISNLMGQSNGCISYPVLDPEGDISFKGETYSMFTERIVSKDRSDVHVA